MKFMGYVREDGSVGSRNYVTVIPSVVCVTDVVDSIVHLTDSSRAVCHSQGCCQLAPDLAMVTNALIGLGQNPNTAGALVVGLGCEGTDTDRLVEEIAATGKPVERLTVQDIGGTSRAIQQGVDLVQKLARHVSGQQRESVDISKLVLGLKCGASDTTSGVSSNPVLGYVTDRLIDEGATVVFAETTEIIGAEQVLARRACTEDIARRIYEIVDNMERRAKSVGVDMRGSQPTPGNIAGGLSSIEEKSLGAIVKSGTRPIQGVLNYDEKPTSRGLFLKDSPGREAEALTGLAVAGAQAMLFSTGRGAPQGFPIVPVLKICGNPLTYQKMIHDMDVNAGLVITGEKSIQQLGEEVLHTLLRVLSGELTKSEAIKYTRSMNIYTTGPVI